MSDRFGWLEFDEKAVATEAPLPEKSLRQVLLDAARLYADGSYEDALRTYSSALKTDKAQHEAWAGQVRCLVRLEELREAQTWAARACQLFPSQPVLESARAYALASSGLLGPALAASDVALETAEKTGLQSPRVWLERGACLLAEGQKSTAACCFDKVRELCPNEPDWEQDVAFELLRAGDAAGALASLNKVVDKRPQRAYAWLLLARAARRLGLRARALQAVEQALALRPEDAAILEERRQIARSSWLDWLFSFFMKGS